MSYTSQTRPTFTRSNRGRGTGIQSKSKTDTNYSTNVTTNPSNLVKSQTYSNVSDRSRIPSHNLSGTIASPSRTRTRGGRMAQPGRNGRDGQPGLPCPAGAGATNDENNANGQQPSVTERMQRRDGYTMVLPDQNKRTHIAERARQEEAKYEEHKERTRLKHVNYVGTVGGGEVTENEVRHRSQQTLRNTPVQRRMRADQDRQRRKVEEDDKIQQKKDIQRKKAENNHATEAERKKQLDADRRRTNASFLDKIEEENRQKKSERILGTSAANNLPKADDHGRGTAVCPEEATAISSPTSLDIQTATLLGEFPDCDYDAMRDILIQTNGDLDLARTLLT